MRQPSGQKALNPGGGAVSEASRGGADNQNLGGEERTETGSVKHSMRKKEMMLSHAEKEVQRTTFGNLGFRAAFMVL